MMLIKFKVDHLYPLTEAVCEYFALNPHIVPSPAMREVIAIHEILSLHAMDEIIDLTHVDIMRIFGFLKSIGRSELIDPFDMDTTYFDIFKLKEPEPENGNPNQQV